MTTELQRLEFKIQKVLPAVYDDSLSFYELLNKVVQHLNEVIDTTNVFFEGGIEGATERILLEWKLDGKLADVINNSAFLDLTTKIDNNKKRVGDFAVNVMEEGAAGDGVKDDTAAIQNAINKVIGLGGGVLFFPKGTYKTVSPLRIESHYVTIKANRNAVLKPTNCDGFKVGNELGSVRYNHFIIDGLDIDMGNALLYTAIRLKNTDEIQLKHMVVAKGKFGIYLDYSYNVTIEECLVLFQTDTALVANVADKLVVLRGQYGNGEYGVQVLGGKGITFIGTSIERNNNVGVLLAPSYSRGQGEYPDGVNFVGCYLERNAMLRGNGFVHVGLNDMNIGDYCKAVTFTGNYYNWDTGNPRNPEVPIYYFDKCSEVSLVTNRYANVKNENYSQYTGNAYVNRIASLNDIAKLQREAVLSTDNQLIVPFLISISTDGTGFGQSTYDLNGYNFQQKYVVGNILNAIAGSYYEIQYPNINQFKVIVRGHTPNSIADFTGVVMGKQIQ